jgi:hypothetical protein
MTRGKSGNLGSRSLQKTPTADYRMPYGGSMGAPHFRWYQMSLGHIVADPEGRKFLTWFVNQEWAPRCWPTTTEKAREILVTTETTADDGELRVLDEHG